MTCRHLQNRPETTDRFQNLTESDLKSWNKAKKKKENGGVAKKKRSRRSMLSESTMAAVEQCIRDYFERDKNVIGLDIFIRATIMQCGEDDKIESGEFKLTWGWIDRLCQEIGLTTEPFTYQNRR